MNNTEARKILDEQLRQWERRGYDEQLRQWERRGYDELARLVAVNHIETPEQTGTSGTRYYMEIQFFWDSSPGGAVRVFGSIDDGGTRAYSPTISMRVGLSRVHMTPNQCAAANRRPAGQWDGSDNLSAIVAADRAFRAAVAELDR